MPANNYLDKAQFDLTPAELTAVYQCPAKRHTLVSIFLCNRSATGTSFRIAVALAVDGEPEEDDLKQYYYYDTLLPANNSLNLPFKLNALEELRVYVPAAAEVSCNISVIESKQLSTSN